MDSDFANVSDTKTLDQLFQRSIQEPIILFMHSTSCQISSRAYREMTKLDREVALLVVQQARQLSQEVETRTGIEHETPQVIVLRNGQAVWNASHWQVEAGAVLDAVRANT